MENAFKIAYSVDVVGIQLLVFFIISIFIIWYMDKPFVYQHAPDFPQGIYSLLLAFGVGYYTKSNAEICLLATRGKPHKLVKDNSISQVIMTPKTKHSRKPIECRERILQMLGDLPRIELFARQKVEGWDCWGNEVESDIKL